MSIVDRLRSMFGGSKDSDKNKDGIDDVVEEEVAIAHVHQDIDRSGLDAVNRMADTPGSADRGTWG